MGREGHRDDHATDRGEGASLLHLAVESLVVSLVVLVVYAMLLEPLGFVISTTLAVGTLSWRMGAPARNAFLTGLISAVVVFVLFNYGLALSLPAGILEVN